MFHAKIKLSLVVIVLFCSHLLVAQKYFTKTGAIQFYSYTPIENITAVSNTATSVYDTETGKIQWAVLVKSFEFEKALMREHFNENYMESSTFPKASFKGQIMNNSSLDLSVPGEHNILIKGILTIHGISLPISTQGKLIISEENIIGECTFSVLTEDYGIKIPAVVKENIAKEIEIKINATYESLQR